MSGTAKKAALAERMEPRRMEPRQIDSVTVDISPGELIDKITILEIKLTHLDDPGKLSNVRREHRTLTLARDAAIAPEAELGRLTLELHEINAGLWEIEDDIRDCERDGNFGPRFIELARAVYRSNDVRADLKKRINQLLGARIVEEKSYSDY